MHLRRNCHVIQSFTEVIRILAVMGNTLLHPGYTGHWMIFQDRVVEGGRSWRMELFHRDNACHPNLVCQGLRHLEQQDQVHHCQEDWVYLPFPKWSIQAKCLWVAWCQFNLVIIDYVSFNKVFMYILTFDQSSQAFMTQHKNLFLLKANILFIFFWWSVPIFIYCATTEVPIGLGRCILYL